MRHRVTALIVAAALCAAPLGCARSGEEISVSGRVSDDLVTVQAPLLATPLPSIDAGFEMTGASLSPGIAENRSSMPSMTAVTGLGSFSRVDTVTVAVGDRVTAGQGIASFDPRVLDASVEVARANHRVARARVPVLDKAIDDTRDASAEISESRATVFSAIDQLTATRPQLVAQIAQLKALLRQLESMPPTPPGGGGPGPAPRGQPVPTPAQLRAAIAQLEAGIKQLDSGLATARSGLNKLSDASATVADARSQLEGLRRLARIARESAAVGVNVALYERSSADVASPFDGIVVSVVRAGDVLAPGATVAVIRRTGDPGAETWLASEDVARIGVGDAVTVSADWFAGSEDATGVVRRIGRDAEHPPTAFATTDVHMTRAIPVEIAITPGRNLPALPPGAPLDLTIEPRSRPATP